jgi:hypothetical protein
MNVDVRKWTWYWKFTWAILALSFGICLWAGSPHGLLACSAVMVALIIPGTLLRIGRMKRDFHPAIDDLIHYRFVGRVNDADGSGYRCTIFRNRDCDDPKAVIFDRRDFDRRPEEGDCFRGRMTEAGIRIVVNDPGPYSPEDSEKELERLLKELPEEF